jgi:serine/threonine protein kinase
MEFGALAALDHPNIVRCRDLYVDRDSSSLIIVTDLIEGGDLTEVIAQNSFSESDAKVIIRTILNVVEYLHDNQIIHKDLKPENIRFEKKLGDKIDYSSLKIVDFGGCNFMDTRDDLIKTSQIDGDWKFKSPGQLAGTYKKSCDIWAIGMIAHLLVKGKMAFEGNTP